MKTMKAHVLLFCLMLAGCLQLSAQEKKPCLVVWYGDYERYSIMLENEPRITFQNGEAKIEADGTFRYYQNEYEYYDSPLTYYVTVGGDYARSVDQYRLTVEERDYEGYTPEEIYLTPIKDLKVDEKQKPMFHVEGGKLVVKGLKEGASMALYGVDGKELGKAEAGRDGKAQVALPQMRGTVVVKAGSVSFKIGVK